MGLSPKGTRLDPMLICTTVIPPSTFFKRSQMFVASSFATCYFPRRREKKSNFWIVFCSGGAGGLRWIYKNWQISKPPNKGLFFFPSVKLSPPVFPPLSPSRPLGAYSLYNNNSYHQCNRKICTKWLHTLTWLNDVWSGVTPSTSPIPSLCSVSPRRTKCKHTHTRTGFPFPEPCFENRSFVLTVNSRAWQVQSDHPLRHDTSPPVAIGNVCFAEKAERHTHTRGMQVNACGKNTEVWWRETCRGKYSDPLLQGN